VKADRIAGIVVFVAGLLVVLATANVDVLAGQATLSARFFPYIIAATLTLGGLLLASRPGDTPLPEVVGRLLDRRGLLFAALFVVYALTFRVVDFRFSTWLFVLLAMWVLGSRRWLELVLMPVLVAALAYMLFRHGFTVMLPTWS
jgi:putative tricarboxylic transport membrane protein